MSNASSSLGPPTAPSRKEPRKRLHDTVVDALLQYVENASLKPGEALPPEREFAQTLGVSRNLLRQGFSVLEERGLIVTRQGAGRFLRDTSQPFIGPIKPAQQLELASIADILEARTLIEVEVIGLACQRRTRDEATELISLAGQLTSWEHNARFHQAIAAATHNFMLERVSLGLAEILGDLHQRDYYNSPDAAREHMDIALAVMHRDEREARELMRQHLTATKQAILRHGTSESNDVDGQSE